MSGKTKVYFIICPISFDVMYIGITGQDLTSRLKQHCNDNKLKHKRDWIRYLLYKGLTPIIKQISEFNSLERAFRAEKFYIKLYGRSVSGDGKLFNMTKGGAGGYNLFGRKLTEEQKKNLSDKQKEKFKLGTLKIPSRLGEKLSKEQAEFLKKINTGRSKTPEELEKLIIANSVEKIYRLDSNFNLLEIYSGMRRASIIGGFTYAIIHRSCKSKGRKTHKGFRFMKEKDYLEIKKTL